MPIPNMLIVNATALPAAFAEWMRQYNADPAQFASDWLDGSTDAEDYGTNASAFLLKLLNSQGAIATVAPDTTPLRWDSTPLRRVDGDS
jgi:hypothetical protein